MDNNKISAMTEDQIKAIAEEYAHIVMDVHKCDPYITGFEWQAEFDACVEVAEDIVGALSTRYCIVEREKVMKEYKAYKDVWDKSLNRDCIDYQKGAMVVMEDLFGASMFNQNEE